MASEERGRLCQSRVTFSSPGSYQRSYRIFCTIVAAFPFILSGNERKSSVKYAIEIKQTALVSTQIWGGTHPNSLLSWDTENTVLSLEKIKRPDFSDSSSTTARGFLRITDIITNNPSFSKRLILMNRHIFRWYPMLSALLALPSPFYFSFLLSFPSFLPPSLPSSPKTKPKNQKFKLAYKRNMFTEKKG